MWELTCGSMFMRLQNPGMYEQILKDNEGRRSASTDDIEKDLHRSCVDVFSSSSPFRSQLHHADYLSIPRIRT